jgi:hypothetical protein
VIIATLGFDNGATGVMLTNFTSGRRVFRVEMHGAGICAEANPEGKGMLYADGDTVGVEYDAREVAGSAESYVFTGSRANNREFIDCLKTGEQPSSNFADAVKTMEVAAKILSQALLAE